MLIPSTVMDPDRLHSIVRKLNSETTLDSRLSPSDSVLRVKSRRSSAMRWSGLSVPTAAVSVARLMW